MADISCFVAPASVPPKGGALGVALYDAPGPAGTARIGGPVLDAVRRLGVRPRLAAFDFLTLALAVTAADTFVRRKDASDVGWDRRPRLALPLADPGPWQPVKGTLEHALGFLTGDTWALEFTPGGREPPDPQVRGDLVDVASADLVCLFSGGLDSAIGVVDLAAAGARPLLVSHAYPGDKAKQEDIHTAIAADLPQFSAVAHPRWPGHPFDTTMRGRSFNFLALAALGADALSNATGRERVTLMVPENGFIAINAPLTPRRRGSLSTRTTHPHFLGVMQEVLDAVGISARIENPYAFKSKGQMLSGCMDRPTLETVMGATVSCGKWKRRHQQCGRCVPCLIRRAAFHGAGVHDPTTPSYVHGDLRKVLADPNQRGDLLGLSRATRWLGTPDLARQVGASGPLPTVAAERKRYEEVVRQGLEEMRVFLVAARIPV